MKHKNQVSLIKDHRSHRKTTFKAPLRSVAHLVQVTGEVPQHLQAPVRFALRNPSNRITYTSIRIPLGKSFSKSTLHSSALNISLYIITAVDCFNHLQDRHYNIFMNNSGMLNDDLKELRWHLNRTICVSLKTL